MSVPLISYASIMKEDLQPVDWLVDRLIAHGDRVLVYGEPGCFKSWLLLDMAIAMASGASWLGQFTVPVAKKVLYVDEEMNRRTVIRRIRRLGMRADVGLQPMPLCILSHYGLRAGEGQLIATFLHDLQASGFDPDVIILETMRQALVGSELEARDVRAFWHYFAPLQQAGKTVIVSHHMRKPSANGVNDSRYRASGSTYILGGCDTAYAIAKTHRTGVAVECVRSRDSEELGIFRVQIQEAAHEGPIVMQFDGFQAGPGAGEPAGVRVGRFIMSFLSHAANQQAKTKEMDQWLSAHHHVSADEAQKARQYLKASGQVLNPSRGLWQARPVVPDQAA